MDTTQVGLISLQPHFNRVQLQTSQELATASVPLGSAIWKGQQPSDDVTADHPETAAATQQLPEGVWRLFRGGMTAEGQ